MQIEIFLKGLSATEQIDCKSSAFSDLGMPLKDPCSEFSTVGILHVRPVEGHFWSPRSPRKINSNIFLGG